VLIGKTSESPMGEKMGRVLSGLRGGQVQLTTVQKTCFSKSLGGGKGKAEKKEKGRGEAWKRGEKKEAMGGLS